MPPVTVEPMANGKAAKATPKSTPKGTPKSTPLSSPKSTKGTPRTTGGGDDEKKKVAALQKSIRDRDKVIDDLKAQVQDGEVTFKIQLEEEKKAVERRTMQAADSMQKTIRKDLTSKYEMKIKQMQKQLESNKKGDAEKGDVDKKHQAVITAMQMEEYSTSLVYKKALRDAERQQSSVFDTQLAVCNSAIKEMETEIKKKEWEQLKDAKKAAGGRTPRRTSTGVQNGLAPTLAAELATQASAQQDELETKTSEVAKLTAELADQVKASDNFKKQVLSMTAKLEKQEEEVAQITKDMQEGKERMTNQVAETKEKAGLKVKQLENEMAAYVQEMQDATTIKGSMESKEKELKDKALKLQRKLTETEAKAQRATEDVERREKEVEKMIADERANIELKARKAAENDQKRKYDERIKQLEKRAKAAEREVALLKANPSDAGTDGGSAAPALSAPIAA